MPLKIYLAGISEELGKIIIHAAQFRNYEFISVGGIISAASLSGIDAIVVDSPCEECQPLVERAKQLGIEIFTVAEFIFNLIKEKTRVVIAERPGAELIVRIVLHVFGQQSLSVDFIAQKSDPCTIYEVQLSADTDFVLIAGSIENPAGTYDGDLASYSPNIAALSMQASNFGVVPKATEDLISSIVPGGILIYEAGDAPLVKTIDNAENYFRKISYSSPGYTKFNGGLFLRTDLGEVPLLTVPEEDIALLEAARHVCNQMGIMDEDFYDAVSTFS